VHIVPWLVDKKFQKVCLLKEEKRVLSEGNMGFDEQKKVVLLAGGGGRFAGPHFKIINQCVLHKGRFFKIAVVCWQKHRDEAVP